ncbi:MAG: helix-turn-helix domain-containing protein [Candidatus Nitrosocosmicus sp.]|nr:helix-turn-helix domain-containing protein [Candidatus Nitrosocosmicus sp.]
MTTTNKTSFERICRTEKNVKVKERMLLVLNVVYYGKVAAHVARTLHKSKAWATQWLKRYREEGTEGLKDRPKSGRRPELPPEVEYEIREILKESNTGWTTKQVEELIIRESGIKYHHNYIYYIVRKWGFKQKVPRKVHVNTASKEEKDEFKKRQNGYLWVPSIKKRTLP